MRKRWTVGALATIALQLLASSAQAIDCRKATTSADRMICADKRLQKADAALGAAYRDLLKATDDAEIRAMLVAGQKRWLERRDDRLGRLGENEDPPDAETQREIMLKAIEARARDLAERSRTDPGLPQPIATALEQRRFAGRYTGGAFAGFDTSCDFLPGGGSYSYGCFGRQRFQNNDRVCTLAQDWATNSISEVWTVGQVVDGKLKTIASCSADSRSGPGCQDPSGASRQRGDWQRPSAAESGMEDSPSPPLPKLDADVRVDEEAPWLPACLTDPTYPPLAPVGGDVKRP